MKMKIILHRQTLILSIFIVCHISFAFGFTADDALNKGADLTNSELLKLIRQTEGDEAMAFSTGLVRKLRSREFVSLPLMAENHLIIAKKINSILKNTPSITDHDRLGLNNFLTGLTKLKEQSYPYYHSLAAMVIFSDLLFIYYSKYEKLKATSFEELTDVELMLEARREKLEQVFNTMYNDFDVSIQAKKYCPFKTSDFLLCIFDHSRLLLPIMHDLTIDDMNFFQYLPLVPLGFTCSGTVFHDGQPMDCKYFPAHDMIHELNDIKSSWPLDIPTQKKRRVYHSLNQGIYAYSYAHHEIKFTHALGLAMFQTQHESGENIDNIDLAAIMNDRNGIIDKIVKGLTLDKKYKGCDAVYFTLVDGWEIPQSSLWLYLLGRQFGTANVCMSVPESLFTATESEFNQSTRRADDYIAKIRALTQPEFSRLIDKHVWNLPRIPGIKYLHHEPSQSDEKQNYPFRMYPYLAMPELLPSIRPFLESL